MSRVTQVPKIEIEKIDDKSARIVFLIKAGDLPGRLSEEVKIDAPLGQIRRQVEQISKDKMHYFDENIQKQISGAFIELLRKQN